MKFKKFQMGGEMPEPGVAPAGEQAPMDPAMGQEAGVEEEIMAMASEIISSIGPEGAAMLAEAIMVVLQSGGGAPEGPVYARRGTKLVRLK